MPSNVSSVIGAAPNAAQTLRKTNPAAPVSSGSPPDRVALQSKPMPALLIGAAAAAQLVPGVVEAEGATGAASAIGVAVRAATANPAARTLIAAGAGAAGSYAKSLLHDATAGQPAFKALANAGHAIDASIRTGLGIASSDQR
ncbi:MAG: hypothetical protein ABSB70_00630 [Candidatus Velthaea sp.]